MALAIEKLIAFPSVYNLNAIVKSKRLDIISPFFSGWSLAKIGTKHTHVRLITRLPDQFTSPPAFMDNDPRPLAKAMRKMGTSLQIYAYPRVHAKVYLNDVAAWAGSANFTRNGFSSAGEMLFRLSQPAPELSTLFNEFIKKSTRVYLSDVDKLCSYVKVGLTELPTQLTAHPDAPDASITLGLSYDDFDAWLAGKGSIAKYIKDRLHNKYRMSGHVFSGYHGIIRFLRFNPKIGHSLSSLTTTDEIPENILVTLAKFVRAYGDKYGGPRGGTWRKKLSTRLGGTHTGGGAGDALAKAILLVMPHFMKEKGLL